MLIFRTVSDAGVSVQGVSPPSTLWTTAEGEEEYKANEGPACGELGASPLSTTQGEGDGKAEEEPACGELGALLICVVVCCEEEQ